MSDSDTEPTIIPTPPSTLVKPGWQTTEFWLSTAAIALTALFASGALTSTTALAIAGMAATVLTALGYKVSRTLVKTAAALILFGAVVSVQVSCSAPAVAGHAVVDCTKADQGAIAAAGLRLLQAPSWSALETEAIAAGETIGGCALLAVIAHYTAPASASLVEGPDPHQVVERVRAHFGGVSWVTADGVR